LEKVRRERIQGTFLDELPDDVLVRVASLLVPKIEEVYEVLVTGQNCFHIEFEKRNDAIEFIEKSRVPSIGKTKYVSHSVIKKKLIARSYSRAIEIISDTEPLTKAERFNNGPDTIWVKYDPPFATEMAKEMKQHERSLLIKKAKIE
jgi:hypothetical protein